MNCAEQTTKMSIFAIGATIMPFAAAVAGLYLYFSRRQEENKESKYKK